MKSQTASPNEPARPRKKKRWFLKIFLALSALAIFLHLPMGQVKLEVSPETTFVTGPLNPDGTVDYVAAFNAHCAKDVTPENNAAPLLLRALGRELIRTKEFAYGELFAPDERILGPLGVSPDELDGNGTFVPWWQWGGHGQVLSTVPAIRGDDSAEEFNDDWPNLIDVVEDFRAGREHPQLQAWLRHNALALQLVTEAALRPKYYLPRVSDSVPTKLHDARMEVLPILQKAGMALQVRSELRARQGDLKGAWQDVLTIHRLARLLAGKPLVLFQLVAVGFDDMASNTGIRLATRYEMPPDLAKHMIAQLKSLGPAGNVQAGHWGESFGMLDIAMQFYRGFETSPGHRSKRLARLLRRSADVNVITRRCNWWNDRVLKAMQKPSLKQRVDAQDVIGREVKSKSSGWDIAGMVALWAGGWPCRGELSRQMVDKALVPMLLPNLSQLESIIAKCDMQRELEILAVALACYHTETGRWPVGLVELVPRFVDRVPVDVFTEHPLSYTLLEDGYLLYSVGRNRRDDGGKGGSKKTDDIVAEVLPPTVAGP